MREEWHVVNCMSLFPHYDPVSSKFWLTCVLPVRAGFRCTRERRELSFTDRKSAHLAELRVSPDIGEHGWRKVRPRAIAGVRVEVVRQLQVSVVAVFAEELLDARCKHRIVQGKLPLRKEIVLRIRLNPEGLSK